ncbi:MAG: hypothetical protein ABMA64_37990 [Myxococcota bacterium]
MGRWLVVALVGLAGCAGDPGSPTDTGACGTGYGADATGCDLTCGAGSYCALCLTADTGAEYTCVPCGAAC